MGMGHVPEDPVHSVGESSQFQRHQRRRTSVRRHSSPRQHLAAQRLARARWAEDRVAQWYVQRGFTILARNWTMRGGELDVVARKGKLVVVCEVKARANNNYGSPLDAMTPTKVARVQRAGHTFFRQLSSQEKRLRLRFDVATVLGTQLEVFEDFF